MKEYECEDCIKLRKEIMNYLQNVLTIPKNSDFISIDILDIIIEKSTLINEKLREDNEKFTLKMIEIENATKGYFRMIERVMNAEN